jgi:hypothetical protein
MRLPKTVSSSYFTGFPRTASADGGGNYAFVVTANWSGTVTPSRSGYIFAPANRTYTNVLTGQTDQNYTAAIACYFYLPLVVR